LQNSTLIATDRTGVITALEETMALIRAASFMGIEAKEKEGEEKKL
jgi:hypothetical protein